MSCVGPSCSACRLSLADSGSDSRAGSACAPESS